MEPWDAGEDSAKDQQQSQGAGNQRGVMDGSRAKKSDKADDVQQDADDDGERYHSESVAIIAKVKMKKLGKRFF
jgi:hypothetical protein